MNPVEECKAEVEAYLKASGLSATRLGADALGDPRFVHQLRDGREPRFSTLEKLRGWMAENPAAQLRARSEDAA